jgi:hypothetical protein
VDQPHEHDREEVELLAEDRAVEPLRIGDALDLGDQEVQLRALRRV